MALVPISALFSALCLALAAFARSTKEGQYYLMPLLLVTMPLVVLPMSPGVELNLGTSLIPVTGVVLLLRSVLEGNYWQAPQFAPVVAAVTLAGLPAGDPLGGRAVQLRVGAVPRERAAGPGALAAAPAARPAADAQRGRGGLLRRADPDVQFLPQSLADDAGRVSAASPGRLLTYATGGDCRAGVADDLSVDQQPAANAAAEVAAVAGVAGRRAAGGRVAPGGQRAAVGGAAALPGQRQACCRRWRRCSNCSSQADFWPLVLLIAVVPAVCEELAFRGFILSGFRHLGHKWRAIVFSAMLFGVTHGILQQSLIACLLGVVLGYLAVQSGSILPGMVFHAGPQYAGMWPTAAITPEMIPNLPLLRKFVTPLEGGGCLFDGRRWSSGSACCRVGADVVRPAE